MSTNSKLIRVVSKLAWTLTGAKSTSQSEKITKITRKAAWTLLGATAGSASKPVEVLHYRDVHEEFLGDEYVHKVGPAYIEPEWGYIITPQHRLLNSAIQVNHTDYVTWRQGIPSVNEFLKVKNGSAGNIVKYQAVISLRHFWEWNYYHFFLDVLGKMSLFDQLDIPRSIPIVLGRYALKLPFVKEALSRGELSNRPLIIQDDAYIFAEEIYYCRIKEALYPRMEHVLQQIDAPEPRLESCDRLFLNRSSTSTRRIINDKEVEDIATKYSFRIVDTGAMSLDAQMKLFAGTRYLIAAHGAGITNIIFRRAAPLALLELRPVSAPGCFQSLAQAYGYSWDNLSGEISNNSAQHANYHIDTTMLENKIKQMLGK